MSDNYFKVPIEKLASKLPPKFGFTEFNPSQMAMLKGLEEHRFWVHISARRTGKSSAAAVLALAKLLEPNQQVLVVAPDYNLSSIIWDYTTELIQAFGIETKRLNLKDRVVRLVNDSTFRLLSANNRSTLVGRAANLLIVDEAAIIPDDEYFTRDLRPALSTFEGSRALFISTPRGKQNYLYNYWSRGMDESHSDWGSGLYPWHVNPALREADINEARRTLPPTIFQQEYYCDWVSFEGQIYKVDDNIHLIDTATHVTPHDPRYTFIGGLDMGFRDDTAFVIAAFDGTNWFVVDEYVASEGTTSSHAEHIKEMSEHWGIENIYIDSAAAQTKADLAYDYDVFCDNAVKSVNDGISSIQVLVQNENIYFDIENTKRTYSSMTGYRWNTKGEKSKPVHDWTSHCCDALRYAIYSYTKSAAVGIYAL
jgi:PBSX family phage terminase large subunit